MGEGQPVPGSLFVYAPNIVAPIIFVVAYATSAVGHIWQCHYYKSWKLIGLHPLCAVMFALGYAFREYGAFNYTYTSEDPNTGNLIIFILSQVFIFICPPLLELSNYHILGRILHYVPYFAPLPPGKVLSTFGGIMGVVELLNSLGVSLSANPSSSHTTQTLGKNLTLAALGIQIAIIIIFLIIAGIFHRRCAKAKIHAKAMSLLITLYISMALILIRCIYRLVEHLGNTAIDLDDPESLRTLSPILRYEWFFYIFEATLMFLNSLLWNIWNPGRYLPKNYHTHLSEDGMTELEGEQNYDDRTLLAKAGSLLTFGILFRKKNRAQRSEELRVRIDHQSLDDATRS